MMNFLIYLSQILLPLTTAYILAVGILKHRPVFEDFTAGAQSGLKTTISLVPTLIGLLVAVRVFRASGLLDALCRLLGNFFSLIGLSSFPKELLPLAAVKLFSASAANGLLFDIFKEYGTDSYLGFAASLIMSCSETMLYCLSIYFGSVNISKTRYTIAGALLCIISGTAASLFLAGILCR